VVVIGGGNQRTAAMSGRQTEISASQRRGAARRRGRHETEFKAR
jgi:hypothetical protein